MPFDLVFFDDLQKLASSAGIYKCSNYLVAKEFKNPKDSEDVEGKNYSEGVVFKTCKVFSHADRKDVASFKGKADFIAIMPASVSDLNFALNSNNFDIILSPFSSNELLFDSAFARITAEKGIPVAFLFSEFLQARQKERALLMKNASLSSKFMQRFGCKVFFFSGAREPEQLRSPEDLLNFAELFGFEKKALKENMSAEDCFWEAGK